jgi:hypothetical protein
MLFFVMGFVGCITWLFSDWIAGWFSAGDELMVLGAYIRWIVAVPLIMSLNMLNVLELLIKEDFTSQFKIGIKLLIYSTAIGIFFLLPYITAMVFGPSIAVTNFFAKNLPSSDLIPVYLLVIESLTLWLYEKRRHRIARLERD